MLSKLKTLWKAVYYNRIASLVILFGGFLLIIIWTIFYFKINNERQLEIDNAVRETGNFARAFEEHTIRTVKSADQTALFLKYQYEKDGRTVNIPRYIKDGRIVSQPFVLLSIIDEYGNLAVSSQVPFKSSNIKDREHFQVHVKTDSGNLFISKPVLGRSSGKWSIQMTRRINKPDGSFGGVVVVSVNPFYFTEFYKQVDLGDNSSITLVGRDGIVRARQAGKTTEIGQNLSNSNLMKQVAIKKRGSYTGESSVDGIKRIYSFRALQDYPLIVLVGMAEDEVLKEYNKRVENYYLVMSIITGLIVLFIVALLFVSLKQKRIEQELVNSRNDLEVKVKQRTNELFIVNNELAAMNKELRRFNQELEEEVAERELAETILKKKNEEIWQIAHFDSITGLPNRTYLNERLSSEVEKAGKGEASGILIFIDLDNLKVINDSFGHTHGDAIIKEAANNIVEAVGKDSFVARVGGDEFIVILPGEYSREGAAVFGDRIVAAIGREHKLFGTRFHLTASAGIAFYPGDGDAVEEIFKNADNAMYAAKKAGKNCWRFYSAVMRDEIYEKMIIINSLRYAVQRNEFSLLYQPKVSTNDGKVIGFEALLRWNSAEHGSISPAIFIPLAEQSALIHPIGEWVLKKAGQFAKRLADAGWDKIIVSINISPEQLFAVNFYDIIIKNLQGIGIKPSQLELEITESALIVSLDEGARKLEKLKKLGVGLALDDFGKGYSSLSYLQRLPVNTLKIDKAFIDIILEEGPQREIIGTIVNMAHVLGLSVVAEGVEDAKQMDYLFQCGCDYIQGFFINGPLPEEEALRFLTENH